MTTHSRPRPIPPHKIVSETIREREALRHWLPFQIPGTVQESRQPTPSNDRLSSANVILTALTQLGIYQVGAERAFVSLFDSEYRYFISEATSGTYLRPSAPNHEFNQPFQLCGTALRRADDACNYTLLNHFKDDPKVGDASVLPVTVVPYWANEYRFKSRTLPVLESLDSSFYAAVPIRTKRGINIGVYSVVNTSHREWTEPNSDRLRDISCTIADHLETESLKAVNRRNARMSRGLGSFLEGGSTLTGWRLGANTRDFIDDSGSTEGNLNSKQQSIQQDMDDEINTSEFSNDDSPKQSRRPHTPMRNASRTMHTMSENRNLGNVLSRAANIIRESVEVEGCIFLDATMAGYRSNKAKSTPNARSVGQWSSTSSDDNTQEDLFCEVKGFSTSGNSSIDRTQGPEAPLMLSEKFMMNLLKQYPQGKVFIFSDDGELQTSDSSSDDVFPWISHPHHQDRQVGQDTRASSVPRNKTRRKSVSRQREGKIISAAFPRARSVAFFPVWDPKQERWRASGLIYTNAPFRTFTVQGELSYLTAFGMLAAAEIMRLEALQDAKVKSDALGSLSHELRSPLHGVLLGTELMADTRLNVFQTNIAHTIETCSRTLLDTIDHLLDYSRVNSFASGGRKSIGSHASADSLGIGKKSLVTDYFIDHLVEDVVESVFAGFNFQHKSINQHITQQRQKKPRAGSASNYADNAANSAADYHEAMDQLTPGISENRGSTFAFGNVTVMLSFDAQCDWLFRFHVGAVRRIVMNIVGNALKYTPEGSINITLTQQVTSLRRRKAAPVVCFRVTDTGKGISEEFLQRSIFKPFSQEDDLSPGTGIGLSLVKRIISQFRGQISIDSQVGVGTAVTVLLPLEKPKLPAEDGVFLGPQADFSDQVQDLAGLRVRLMFGSTASTVSADLRKNLEHTCREWLKLELLAQDDESKKPDLMLWTQDALPPTSEFTQSLALIPNVVICTNAVTAYDKGRECYKVGWRGIFEFVSQPIGPRKLAKTLSVAYSRWVDDTDPLSASPPFDDPVINRPPVFGRNSSSSDPPQTSPNDTSHSTTKPDSESPPVGDNGDSTRPPIAAPHPSDPGHEASTILLVEDNHINLKILATYMKKLKLRYDTAVNGKEAVEKYTQSPGKFLCILLDISMPVMNGFEAARQIRAFETREKIENGVPLFAISGLASEEAQREAYGSGINLFLSKPVKLQVLGDILRERGILDSGDKKVGT
ncbi:hypothetical protein FPOAC2_07274 [Fusarium poae]